jgi:peroxisomal 3,2-trans-enoyl-CoA isomerase
VKADLLVSHTEDGVLTLTLNNPRRLNGWTRPMLQALSAGLDRAASDSDIHAVILTGTDPYYCAGVNLAGAMKLGHPKVLRAQIVQENAALFELFLRFPKPILVAVNGPAIGASVTSATLCDGIIASERATFSTPFHQLRVAAEGCSSVLFAERMGERAAQRMLGPEGWKPTGEEAVEIGLAQWCVPHETLLAEARTIAREWVEAKRPRTLPCDRTLDELLAINARESAEVADSFLRRPFLKNQYRFLKSRKKWGLAAVFFGLYVTQPVWSRLP